MRRKILQQQPLRLPTPPLSAVPGAACPFPECRFLHWPLQESLCWRHPISADISPLQVPVPPVPCAPEPLPSLLNGEEKTMMAVTFPPPISVPFSCAAAAALPAHPTQILSQGMAIWIWKHLFSTISENFPHTFHCVSYSEVYRKLEVLP